ncbi:threonine-phosphate decarboxylase CobD [Prosthecomicrobium pneumaticum]|uniref:threonine-phosphate decarboxylase n=1 Tax=Prosthecomicrobium pneumaticum TaxID=81895 RepID=A0A7W9FPT3_9HYPH|nr:threonine-phosphate decarboxylase CobD [Prosthecomicrobium pneumaticum]MBB5754561.1 cobalamin biosynthetic protein CobC [Prosthecomicrobium pneumaticum]
MTTDPAPRGGADRAHDPAGPRAAPDAIASPAAPKHGGGLAAAAAHYGIRPGDWLDLSTGINPRPYPLPPLDATAHRLPDPAALAGLLATARRAYRLADRAALAAAPGSDLALRLLPLVAPPGPVAILSPTYSGHDEAWRAAGRTVRPIAALDEAGDAAVVVLCNPDNPTARILPPERLAAFAGRLGAAGGLLVVDEAFADSAPECSLAPRLGGLSAVVLRSFGKFYGLAGLRLGFVAGAPAAVDPLARLFGDWPVSGPAIGAATAALADIPWQVATRARLDADSHALAALLAGHGLTIIGRAGLFVLAAHPRAHDRHAALARAGIWTRIFSTRSDWIRFGVPTGDGRARLAAALQAG